MKDDNLILDWPDWPTNGRLDRGSKQALAGALAGNTARYTKPGKVIMSFPGTAVHPIAATVYRQLLGEHPNHIGLHTAGLSEDGFRGTQDLETWGVQWLAKLLGDENADGYFNSGGTEANIMGLWVGRNMLRQQFGDPLDRRICVFASFLTHYSVRKACDILGLGEGNYQPCTECQVLAHFFHPERDGSGLHFVPTDEYGTISQRSSRVGNLSSLANLQLQIEKKIGQGFRRFILVANAGTTMTGGVDDISAMSQLVEQLQAQHKDAGFYLHVDAAFGGLVGPFLDPAIPCGFVHPAVSSVTVDPHKMGLTAYPCGAFLARKNLLQWVNRKVGYVGGHNDCTVSGSRSGAAAVAASLLFRYIGQEGYQQIVRNCMKVTEHLRHKLGEITGVQIYPSQLNILPLVLTHERLERILLEHHRIMQKEEHQHPGSVMTDATVCKQLHPKDRTLALNYFRLRERYTLMGEWLPDNLGDLESHPRRIHKIVVMPHAWVRTRASEVIDKFVADIRKLLATK